MSKLFEALFVALDALLFASFLSSSFDIVFYLLSEPLGVDFELPNRPSDLQKCLELMLLLLILLFARFSLLLS